MAIIRRKETATISQRAAQEDYNRILDSYSARERGLGQVECENVLIKHGASDEQAKNGAYVYLHHDGNSLRTRTGSRREYDRLLESIDARNKKPKECIEFLKSKGFTYRQAQTAVYQYRRREGLIGT